jgi:hypothetical protein
MKRLRSAPLLVSILLITSILSGCGKGRRLESVTISPPAAASSQAQFIATGIYNDSPKTADITASTAWCIGSVDGFCVGNVAVGATVNAGMAECLLGYSGTVTVLAGEAGPRGNPDGGFPLKPFGAAQLTCP